MFLSREICIKPYQNYTKIHIQQICNQSENDFIPQELENLRFSPITYFLFCILIDIMDNIIT